MGVEEMDKKKKHLKRIRKKKEFCTFHLFYFYLTEVVFYFPQMAFYATFFQNLFLA
jgi:hypothetical protein